MKRKRNRGVKQSGLGNWKGRIQVNLMDADSGSHLLKPVQDWHVPKLCAVVFLRLHEEEAKQGSETVWSWKLEGENPSLVNLMDAGSGSHLLKPVQDWHVPKLCAVVYLRLSGRLQFLCLILAALSFIILVHVVL
ncbi:unnamed protein product [Cochlearia groenlandica]